MEKDVELRSRPQSYYENSSSENKQTSNNNVKECKFIDSLSQTQCLNTTVPQAIGKQDIGGKHTPTRNSLRHSRMIVLNRSEQVASSQTPLFLKYSRLVKSLLILTILLGISLCVLALWLHIWSPNMESKGHWSAIPALLSGAVGILFINICPKIYNIYNSSYCKRSIQYISIALSVAAAITALVMFIMTLLYVMDLFSKTCAPLEPQNTCICTNISFNGTSYSYHYVDLNCSEVEHILTGIVVYTCVTNLILTLLKCIYLYFHWVSRNVYIYTRVSLNDNHPTTPPK